LADSNVTRKLEIYRALFRLNRAFAHLAHNLDWLTSNRVLIDHVPGNMPEWWAGTLEETQAEMNRRLTETLHNLEHGDVKNLGRILEMAPHIRAKYYPPDKADSNPQPPRKRKPRKSRK